MLSRRLIIQIVLLVLPYAIETLKKEAQKSPNPYDDMLIQIAEAVLAAFKSGEIKF